jgi:hypothetical protein
LYKNSTYTQEHCGSERRHWKDPHRSARRYSVSLELSEASVRRILHNHLSSLLYITVLFCYITGKYLKTNPLHTSMEQDWLNWYYH